ncbi:FitA-like ribbon-helix-helix domain-containing protein [Ornithinimicrobium sp. LYQ103]|uniref:FitA-like ribbon-helix-helix domain-containing protein n=1 Tax=Ornithinimicrobium sp. LYQ103 TaxID=3378796 RepID=UPI003851B674
MSVMATVTVRGLDDEVRRRLKVRAAANDRSMEAEVRAILTATVAEQPVHPAGATSDPSDLPVGRSRTSVLTSREERIAGLVSQGLTNRQIAGALFLSERTVESHVSAILRKLGFHSRATVASWYTARPTPL